MLTAGGLLLLGGRLGDLLGRRRMFVAGMLAVLGLGAERGRRRAPGMLVASRFLQGAAEAVASPAAFGLVALFFPDGQRAGESHRHLRRRGRPGRHPRPGDLRADPAGPQLALDLYINIPVAVATVIAVRRLVEESKASAAARPAHGRDGAVLATAGLVSVVYGLIAAGSRAWGSAQVLVSLVGGVALIGFIVAREHTAANPLVPSASYQRDPGDRQRRACSSPACSSPCSSC